MKQYTITRISGQPDWNSIPTLQVDVQNWKDPVDISTTAQICYDENGLYVHMRSREAHIRAEEHGPLAMVCKDSCMEFFFRPDENDPRYFNFEMNPLGFTYVGLCYNLPHSCRLAPALQKETRMLEDGWEIFYTIPLSFLQVFFPGYKLTPGKIIYANCFKCGDLTVQKHYLSWNPCTSPKPAFHVPKDFGKMVLGE